MANLYGTLDGARGTTSRTGTDLLRARLATWHGAVVVTLDDYGAWTLHTEPADPQEAAAAVPRIIARGNLHTGAHEALPDPTAHLRSARPNRSPARKPGPSWTPYTIDERSPTA